MKRIERKRSPTAAFPYRVELYIDNGTSRVVLAVASPAAARLIEAELRAWLLSFYIKETKYRR